MTPRGRHRYAVGTPTARRRRQRGLTVAHPPARRALVTGLAAALLALASPPVGALPGSGDGSSVHADETPVGEPPDVEGPAPELEGRATHPHEAIRDTVDDARDTVDRTPDPVTDELPTPGGDEPVDDAPDGGGGDEEPGSPTPPGDGTTDPPSAPAPEEPGEDAADDAVGAIVERIAEAPQPRVDLAGLTARPERAAHPSALDVPAHLLVIASVLLVAVAGGHGLRALTRLRAP
jgi:hypothetical protein